MLDIDLGNLENELSFEKTFNNFNWDFENIWNNPKDSIKPFLPTFIKEKFYFELPQSEDKIEISTAEELFNITAKINDGDKKYSAARYLLKNNINLRNKKWTPIGIDENNPFTSTFDGGGYRISNMANCAHPAQMVKRAFSVFCSAKSVSPISSRNRQR